MGASPDRSYTVLNGCDTGLFFPRSRVTARETLGIAQDAEIVLYVGNLNHTKGLRELLRACVALSSRRPRLELTVIGEGALRAELNSGPPVRLLGRRSSEEVAMWMAAADVFCLPSYSEGCPNVVLEALACGRPVVASDVGGIPELVNEQNGILVPPRNWERLADALEQALAGSWDEAGIAERAGRSWEDTARDTIRILEKVVK
jgi:glycosyltransferase involved in cell wall biosynthesis